MERRMQDAIDCMNNDTLQELSYKHELRRVEQQRDELLRRHEIDLQKIEQLKDGCVKLNFEIDSLAEKLRLCADKARIDWLADTDNQIGNVTLPSECVLANSHSLRAAIDAAMQIAKAKGVV
jgi:hypothetical protein